MKKLTKFIPVLVLGIFVGQTVLAADFVSPQSNDDPNVTISATESHHNLYVAGANVNINSDTSGDLYAGGAMVNLVGDVEQDVNIAGGSLSLSGVVGGDARIVGGNITINSTIGGDLLLAGGNVNLNENASIANDAVIGGGNITLNAPVNGSLKIAGGNININSQIEGDVTIKSTESLTFGPNAEVLGKINYEGPKAAKVDPGAKVSEIQFKQVSQKKAGAGFLLGALIIKFLAWFVTAWVLLHFFRTRLEQFFVQVQGKPWSSMGIGLATLILTPLVAIALLFTFIGYYLSLIIGVSFILLLLLTCVTSAIFIGHYLAQRALNKTALPNWQLALGGSLVWLVVSLVPIIGTVVLGLVFLMCLGAIVISFKKGPTVSV